MSEVAAAVAAVLGRPLRSSRRVGGGDLNDAWMLEFVDGTRAFVKTRADPAPGEYAAEAAGLRWLGEPDALAVPQVLAAQDGFLALEWIEPGRLDATGEEELGRGLAAVHAAGAPAFGFTPHGGAMRIGPLQFPGDGGLGWPAFYAEHRIRPLARTASDRGALPDGTAAAIERVCERMPDLAGPPEPPARLHGDLWGGNVLTDARGRPHLIDPAAYGGHREVDLAMLRLFGGAGARCFAAYAEVHPLAAGHQERVELYQLLPLLVHAVLFGGGYGTSVARIARRYAAS